jgi:hypothetical protein
MVTGHKVNNDSGLYSENMRIPMVTGHKVNSASGYKGLYGTDDYWSVI